MTPAARIRPDGPITYPKDTQLTLDLSLKK